jgi:hypothetical protein
MSDDVDVSECERFALETVTRCDTEQENQYVFKYGRNVQVYVNQQLYVANNTPMHQLQKKPQHTTDPLLSGNYPPWRTSCRPS